MKNKKPYRFSKKAGRYIPNSQKSSREYYHKILMDFTVKEFDPHSTYGKFIMNIITPHLKKYKNQRLKDNLKDFKLETYKNTIQNELNINIHMANSNELEFRKKEIKELAYQKHKTFRLFHNYGKLIPIPFSMLPFLFFGIKSVLAFLTPMLMYLMIYLLILKYKSNIENQYFKRLEYQYDSDNLKSLKLQWIESNEAKVNDFLIQQNKQILLFQEIQIIIIETFKKLNEDNWLEFVLSNSFYNSTDWQKIRILSLEINELKCNFCGNNNDLSVDHIKPRSRYPELALDIENTQILCRSCNSAKGNKL